MCAFAATIAILLLQQSLVGTSTTQRAVGVENAHNQVAALRVATEDLLRQDPFVFLTDVLPNEHTRDCLTQTPTTQVAAENPWACGTTWTYTTPTPTSGVWIQVTPPSATQPGLQIDYHHANPDVVETVLYHPHQAGVFAVHSTEAGLDMATLGAVAPRWGGFLAATTLTTTAGSTLTNQTSLAAGAGVAGDTGEAWVYTPGTTPPVSALTTPAGSSVVSDTITNLLPTVCPDEDPVNIAGAPSHLCLTPGGSVLLADNITLVTLPMDMVAAALVADPTTGVLELRYTTTAPDVAVNDTNPVKDVRADAAARVTAGTFGGQRAAWTVAGPVTVPTSGVVAATVDVWVGMCDASTTSTGFMDSTNGVCATTTLPEGTTLLVANNDPEGVAPQVWLSGPLVGERLSVLTTGVIVKPWFASTLPTYGDASLNQVSWATTSDVVSFPQDPIVNLTPIRFRGIAVTPEVVWQWEPFSTDSYFSPHPSMAENPPTWFPGTQVRWTPVAMHQR